MEVVARIGTDVWAMFCAMVGDIETVSTARERSVTHTIALQYRTPLSFAVRENQPPSPSFCSTAAPQAWRSVTARDGARSRIYEMVALLERKLSTLHGGSEAGEAVAARIRERDTEGMRRLLDERPELLHVGDLRTSQPIHWATMTRQPELIDELLQRGADINAVRYDGARPIHLTNGDYFFRGWRDVPRGRPTHDEVYRHLVARYVRRRLDGGTGRPRARA